MEDGIKSAFRVVVLGGQDISSSERVGFVSAEEKVKKEEKEEEGKRTPRLN